MIIGISGKKQHGKDTVANIIQYLTSPLNQNNTNFEEFVGYYGRRRGFESPWEKKQFAAKLKEIVCLIIGCDMDQLEDNDFKEKELGEEWRIYEARGWNFENQMEYQILDSKEAIPEGYTFIQDYLPTPRKLLQFIGTECGRKLIHPNIWVNATMVDYKYLWKSTGKELVLPKSEYEDSNDITTPNWIITDTRFPNEAKAIKDRGGIIIRVERPNMISNDNHSSETSLDNYTNFDAIIINDGSIEYLINAVKTLLIKFNII